jgi:8-oxo-dGTP pyrophosphatase MutT (NUDIX family)
MSINHNDTIVFGTKPTVVDDTRRNARVVLYNPQTELFALQYSAIDQMYFTLGGGVHGEDSFIDTAKRELTEESGYVDFEIATQLGGQIVSYYHTTGIGNKERISTGFLAILQSDKNVGTNLEDYEIESGHTTIWKTQAEMIEIFKRQSATAISFMYHFEFCKRAIDFLTTVK